MSPREGRSVSPVDAAWLRMDAPTNQMVITTLLRFDAPLDPAALEATTARLLEHRRFRQRPVRDRGAWTGWSWQDDPRLDVTRHRERHVLPSPGDGAALDAFVSARMSEPLPKDRPLWKQIVVDGVGRGSALLFRVHHAVGDGVTLVRLLLGVSGASAQEAPVQVGIERPKRAATLRRSVAQAEDQLRTLARLLLLPRDHATSLRGALGTDKRTAMSRPFSLETIRDVARRHGGHVNDVLSAAVAGAVRTYLGDAPPLRALVPVFFRDDGGSRGNHFGLVYLPLPTDDPDPLRRLEAIQQAMDRIKTASDAAVAFAVLGGMGLLSPALERLGIGLFTAKASMLVTNVPGPAGTVRLAGQDVRSMVVWAPTSGSIGLGFSLLTYAGELRLGVAADAGRVPDPGPLVGAFERELSALGV